MANENKPMIRHCKNCIYSDYEHNKYSHLHNIRCDVEYKVIQSYDQRTKALFCRHYKQRSDNNAE